MNYWKSYFTRKQVAIINLVAALLVAILSLRQ